MFKLLNIYNLIFLNKYAQHVVDKSEILNWFESLDMTERSLAVKEVWILATQAHISEDDIDAIAEKAGLKSTHTPVVMLKKATLPLKQRGFELANLKGTLLKQAFCLVVEWFAFAEERRKDNEIEETCNHWWHRDLSDARIVDEIIKENK